jgi:chromosome segregation ATPase
LVLIERCTKAKSTSEDVISELRRTLQCEQEASAEQVQQLRVMQGQITALEAAVAASISDRDAAAAQSRQDKDALMDANAELKRQLEDTQVRAAEDKTAHSQKLRESVAKVAELQQQHQASEARFALLEQEHISNKTKLADTQEELRSLRGIELKYINIESRLEKALRDHQVMTGLCIFNV